MNDKERLANFEAYWELVNAIDKLCMDSIDEEHLWMDDAISALDRVKTDIIQEQAKLQINKEANKLLDRWK